MSDETKQPFASLSDEHRRLAQAIKDWWRETAKEWWSSSGRTQAFCDDEGEPIPQGEGFKTGQRLICERCANNRLTQNVNWDKAIRDPETWFGPSVPHHLIKLAEQLWAAPQPSAAAEFTMRIGNVFDSGAGVMVAGSPQGILPGAGDEVEVVGAQGTQKAMVTAHTTMGARAAFTLEGIATNSVKVGDILQFRRKAAQPPRQGAIQETELKKCPNCGQPRKGSDWTCLSCGHTNWGNIAIAGILSLIGIGTATFFTTHTNSRLWQTVAIFVCGGAGVLFLWITLDSIATGLKARKKRV